MEQAVVYLDDRTDAKVEQVLTNPVLAMEARPTADDFDRIMRTHQRQIFRTLVALVGDADLADNLTQECFLRAYQNLARFRGECSITTWLTRIAINLAKDHHRSRRQSFWKRLFAGDREEVLDAVQRIADAQPSAERRLIAREQLGAVWAALDKLPGQQRIAFLLRFSEERPLAEIAEIMDLEVGTVKAHLARAVAAVRRLVQEEHK